MTRNDISRRLRRTLLIGAVLVLAVPAPAVGFVKAFWGPVSVNGVSQFPIYHQLGVSIYEADLNWSQIAPRRPRHPANPHDAAYRWPADVKQAIRQAARYRMRVLLQISLSPGWANAHRPPNWGPTNPKDYANFAAAASREFPSVHLWMVWGEPTRHLSFEPPTYIRPGRRLNRFQQRGPHLYARILDAAYVALKKVSSRNLIVGGDTFSAGDVDTLQWIQNLRLPNGRPPRMDMYGHNPFTNHAPSFSDPPSPKGQVQFSDLPRLARWVDRYLRRGMPLFLSEFTIPTSPDLEFPFWVDAPVAARWIRDALVLSRHWHRIYALGWIHLYDNPPGSYGGLVDVNGHKKPGFWAFEHG